MTYTAPLKWRLMRRIIRWTVSDAARRTLGHRTLTSIEGQAIRWLRPEIERFLEALEQEAEALHVGANLEILPTFGNRLMVEIAVYTAAFDRALRGRGIALAFARQAMAVMGPVAA